MCRAFSGRSPLVGFFYKLAQMPVRCTGCILKLNLMGSRVELAATESVLKAFRIRVAPVQGLQRLAAAAILFAVVRSRVELAATESLHSETI